MIWVLFAIAAGVATWAAMSMRSGTMTPERGRPLAWGAGATAGLLFAVALYGEVQQQRMVEQIMGRSDALLDMTKPATASRSERRAAAFEARREQFDRDFRRSQDDFANRQADFDRRFKERTDRFDRAFDDTRAAIEAKPKR